jgi:hypothetical protein
MSHSIRTLLEQIPYFVVGFGMGIAAWKWKGEDAEENIMAQAIGHVAAVLGYLYARSQTKT